MIIAEINTVSVGSTGKIMLDLAEIARDRGHTVYTYSSKMYKKGTKKNVYKQIPYHTYYGSEFTNIIHKSLGQITGLNGLFSVRATLKLIEDLRKKKVEIIHLHNLHDFCINIPILFRFIKKNNIRVIWTLHDCWSFTGHCPYFTMINCDKWRSGCGNCPQKGEYPKSYMDTTSLMWKKKKKWFSGINSITLVTPSSWLAELVKQSFLSAYPVKVINNGIDLTIFKYKHSDFRKQYALFNKFIILGVAFGWDKRKGLDTFIELSKCLDNNAFSIVLVGTDNNVDTILPDSIISIHRTNNQTELAEIYSASDLFIIPTREDNFPTVNMEAIACGTPVLTYRTGGSPEMVNNETGIIVDCDDFDNLKSEILKVYNTRPFSREHLIKNAQSFNKWNCFQKYIELYEQC